MCFLECSPVVRYECACGVRDPHGVGLDADEGASSGASAQTPLLDCQLVWPRSWLPVVGALDSRVGVAKRVEMSWSCVALKPAPASRIDGAMAVMMKIDPRKRVEISGERVAAKTAPGSRNDGAQVVMMKTVTPANMAAVHADMRSIFSGRYDV